jgi:hypothetical protein
MDGRGVVEPGFHGGSALLDHFRVVLTAANHVHEGAGEGQGFHRSPSTGTPALSSTTKADELRFDTAIEGGEFFGVDGLAAGLGSAPSGAKDDIDSFNRRRFGFAIGRT